MCDFSLHSVRTRNAQVEDKVITTDFGTGTRGFATADDLGCAVCVKPGTEIAFDENIRWYGGFLGLGKGSLFKTAIFRQINTDKLSAHHDALELPDGKTVLLTMLEVGQTGRVLQLPAAPTTPEQVREQSRVAWAG